MFHTIQYIKNFGFEGMRALFLVMIAIGIIVISPAYGQTNFEFGYQLHPGKLLENTEGILQIYIKTSDLMIPNKISDLKVTSSDSKIIQILGIENSEDSFSTIVRIKAVQAGEANIAVAAQGFVSKEIPVTVFTNNVNPTKLSIKATPNDFAVDGQKFGYVSVEVLTSGDLPTKTTQDITVKLLSPDSDVLELEQDQLLIESGKYFAMGTFKIKKSGDALIFAQTEGMKKVSAKVHVREAATPLTLKLYTYPQTFLVGTNNAGYAVVQLEDADGVPVKATEDIEIKIAVENPEATANFSHDYEEVRFDSKELTIPEGKYSTYTKFTPRPDFSDLIKKIDEEGKSSSDSAISRTFDIGISANNYHVEGSMITVSHDSYVGALNGKGPVVFQPIPFLTTGEKELVGIAYLETDIQVSKQREDNSRFKDTVTVPVMSDEKFVMNVGSSNTETVRIIDPKFEKGANAVLVFGDTGTVNVDEDDNLKFTFEDNEGIKKFSPLPEGPIEDNLSLTTESLVSKILVDEEFFILSYMLEQEEDGEETSSSSEDEEEEENGRLGPTHFISDTVIAFDADDIFEIESKSINQNEPYSLLTAIPNKIGTSTISATAGKFETSISLSSETTDPTKMHLSHLPMIYPGTESLATIQLLDSADNPVYVKKDTEIKLVTDNKEVIKVPENVTIQKDEYYATFTINAISDGGVKISALADNLPLEKFDVTVKSVTPNIVLNTKDSVLPNEELTAEMKISFDDQNIPVSGYSVEWQAEGANIVNSDGITNDEGIAKAYVLSTDPKSFRIFAKVHAQGFFDTSVTKPISVIQPKPEVTETPVVEESTSTKTEDNSMNTIENNIPFIVLPVAVGAGIFFLKKTNRLDDVLERISIGEKVEEIKERITNLRDR